MYRSETGIMILYNMEEELELSGHFTINIRIDMQHTKN